MASESAPAEAGELRPDTLARRAYARIKERILLGEIAPLTPIDERALMADLAVGRTPVREALQRLAHEGLVIVIPYRGTMASGIDMSDLDQVMEMRVPLEILAGRLAARRIRPAEAVRLEAMVGSFKVARLCAEENFVELLRLDQRFHREVTRLARNRFLDETLEGLRDLTWRFHILFFRRRPPSAEESFNNYREIVAALKARDADLVEQRLREHFRDSLALFGQGVSGSSR